MRRILLTALTALACLLSLPARAETDKEALVKAAYMYNFLKFIEWPNGSAIAKKNHIDICVYHDPEFAQTALPVLQKASTSALTVSLIEEPRWQNAAAHCHMLYIGQSEAVHIEDITAGLQSSPVLTISDAPGFVEQNGMIGFILVDGKLKLAVNTHAATAAGLHINAQLLEIAVKVIRN